MRKMMAMIASGLALSVSAHAQSGTAPDKGVVVETIRGAVEGRLEGGEKVFRGIPYAAPPVGDLRWRAPEPAPAWQGIRPATQFAAPCMQQTGPGMPAMASAPSEDCLYLNVWAPASARTLPVLVWIHGGAFRGGTTADPRINGDELARRGIVVVSLQYRLGVFGFLSHPGLSAETAKHVSGNYGLRDQIAALQWVRDNIARFGGDPARVTIGGQSAGAISAAMLAAAPQAKGLFHGILSMSGGSFAPPRSPSEGGENMEPLARSEAHGLAFARKLGAEDIAALRRLPAAQIQAGDGEGVAWPVIDGDVIPGDEYRLFKQGRIARVPLMLGSTSDEGFTFSRIRSLEQYRVEVARRYGAFAPEILKAYPAENDAQAVRQGRDLTRDVMFGWGTWAWGMLASDQPGKTPVHSYYFDHRPPPGPNTPADAGSVHGADLPYPFGIDHQQRDWTPKDRAISAAMAGYVVRFVETGDPNGPGLPAWPAFAGPRPQVLRIDRNGMAPGPVANAATIEVIDRYMTLRRKQGLLGAPQ